MISTIRIPVIQNPCDGIYLRWWFNGWHYYNFTNMMEINMVTSVGDIMVTRVFSRISRIERPVKTETEYSYIVALDGITAAAIDGFANLLMAERVEQYESGVWREVDITRNELPIRVENSPAWSMEFEITRKELPNTPAVFQQSQYFYIGDMLAELDDGEVIALTKQVNDIAELQDRQTDFTASFKIRKTRAMRNLFELSGDPQSNTDFPYTEQSCRLIQNGIEMITGGRMVLLKKDDDYYHVSVYSGNMNFFTETGKLKLTDLDLADVDHTWNLANVYGSQIESRAYLYPLIEPSDDGGYLPIDGTATDVTMDNDKVWPHVQIRAIWDAIFAGLGFTSTGKHITSTLFNAIWMPIVNRNAGDVSKYLYSAYNNTLIKWTGAENLIGSGIGTIIINGIPTDTSWMNSTIYVAKYTAKHKFRAYVIWRQWTIGTPVIQFAMWYQSAWVAMTLSETESAGNGKIISVFTGELDMTAGETMQFGVNRVRTFYFDLSVTAIENPLIGVGSDVIVKLNMPQITQSDFIKMICNMMALVPECNPRTRNVDFWSFNELYENIPIARDWSEYLSESGEETEFKFGDYAKRNYMRFKESDDVIPENGTGMMQINDVNLAEEKPMIAIPISYSDEVLVLDGINVSRINMNIYDPKLDTYNASEKIDPRIIYVKTLSGKNMHIRDVNGTTLDVIGTPKAGSSIEISFGSLGANYAPLANMLYRATLRRLKFNLPVYEVAGLKHNIPVYLRQYAAYFYVNKVNNFVAGKLCTVDLIKL
jgi:hypothetical protein